MQAPPPLSVSEHALFLDFDGTLAPLQDDPAMVFISQSQTATLRRIAEQMDRALAIISGRDIQDLGLRIPSDLTRIGGHGLDVSPPGALPVRTPGEAPETLATVIGKIADELQDVWVESKGRVLAVHYRANPDVGNHLHAQLDAAVVEFPDYRIQAGKMVFEAKPSSANKGLALKTAMQSAPFAGRTPILIGDDRTDEDAILAAIELEGFGVKVGPGDSAANWRLADTNAVWNWLEAVT